MTTHRDIVLLPSQLRELADQVVSGRFTRRSEIADLLRKSADDADRAWSEAIADVRKRRSLESKRA